MTEFPVVAKGDADLSGFIASFAAGTATLSTFASAATIAATAGAALVAIALIPAIEAAAEFQEEMIKLNTLVGISKELMGDFEEAILDLAPALGKTPQELARAMFAITSGGERSAAALDLLTQSAKASRIGLGDTATIARVGTAALQAFADQGLTAAQAIDIMVGTVREGNLVADELPNAFGRVIGIAGQMGVTFEEVGTFMATFTRLGVSAEIAATSLRATLFALLNPGKEAKKTFDQLGISVEEMRRRIKDDGLTDAMLSLLEATEGNLDILSDIIPNIRAMSGVLGVYAAQADQVVTIQKNMNNIFGVTNEGFETIQGNVTNSVEELKASIATLAVNVGRVFLPATKLIIDQLAFVFGNFAAAGEGAIKFGIAIGEGLGQASREMRGFQQDTTDLENKLVGFRADAEAATIQQLVRIREQIRAQKELVGAGQRQGLEGAGGPNELVNRMNLLTSQERILNELIERRADELLPKLMEGVRVVVGQTEEQIAATEKLIDRLEEQILSEKGLTRELFQRSIAELNLDETQRKRIEGLEEERLLAIRNAEFLERLADARDLIAKRDEATEVLFERLILRGRRRRELEKRADAQAQAALETEIMVARMAVALNRQAQLSKDVSRVITDSFEDIIKGTKDTSEAFADMVTNILAEFARLKIESALVGFLNNLFIPIPGTPTALPDPVLPPGALDFSLPSLAGSGLVQPSIVSSEPSLIVQQTIIFSPNLIDGRSGARFIRENAEEITDIVSRAAAQSSAFAGSVSR